MGASPEKVGTSFQERWGIHTFPPVAFDYRLLRDYDVVVVQGRRVPKLLFERGSAQAKVYIVEDGQFDLGRVAAEGGGGSVSARTEVRPADRAGFHYVIVYTGESLEPFLNGGPGAD